MNIPKGHQVIMPYFILDAVDLFIEFVLATFEATITYQAKNDDGSTGHCELQIGGATIMCSGTRPEWPARNADLFVYVDNADTSYDKALKAGGTTVSELSTQDYGRTCGVKDPCGNIWWITSI
jgi:uncharacterized glyoxalase superfamily protein PhnB